jgi:hypothetical protein
MEIGVPLLSTIFVQVGFGTGSNFICSKNYSGMKALDLHKFYKFTKNFRLHNQAGSEQGATLVRGFASGYSLLDEAANL